MRIVQTERGPRGQTLNAARNAKIHIATYQTLGLDSEEEQIASFLTEHYPANAFSVIVIDECHRSAWGRWSEVLRRNPGAIQIGLTATPRKLAAPKRQRKAQADADDEITAHNIRHFGEPVYEYGLIQAQQDGYLADCEIVKLRPSIDGCVFRPNPAAHSELKAATHSGSKRPWLPAESGHRFRRKAATHSS